MKRLIFICLLALGISASASPQSFFMFTGAKGGGSSPSSSGIDSLTGGSVSNASTMDININFSGYTIIWVEFSVTPATDNTTLEMLVSANSSTYDNSSGNYTYAYMYSGNPAAGVAPTSSATGNMIPAIGNTSGYHSDGMLQITNPASTSQFPVIWGQMGIMATGGGGGYPTAFCITRTTKQATQKIRLLFSSGNITGTYTVRGMRF
jgi:hypothetical protein